MSLVKAVCVASAVFSVLSAQSSRDFSITASDWTFTSNPGEEFTRDWKFMFRTVFPDPARVSSLAKDPGLKDGLAQTERTNRILARLFVVMAYGGLTYCTEKNDVAHRMDWPWPLATALGHGQRVVFDLKGADAYQLYNLLVNGAIDPNFRDPFPRTAASHGFTFENGQLKEVKYSGGTMYKSLTDPGHHGINIAFGGLGSPRIDNLIVGPGGTALKPTGSGGYTAVKGQQHGHLFLNHALFYKDRVLTESGLMVGLETSAPGSSDMFGSTHDASSAAKNSTEEISVAGGEKMQKLLAKTRGGKPVPFAPNGPPSQYGGMWVLLNRDDLWALPYVIKAVDSLPEEDRKKLLWNLLPSNGLAAQKALFEVPTVKKVLPVGRMSALR